MMLFSCIALREMQFQYKKKRKKKDIKTQSLHAMAVKCWRIDTTLDLSTSNLTVFPGQLVSLLWLCVFKGYCLPWNTTWNSIVKHRHWIFIHLMVVLVKFVKESILLISFSQSVLRVALNSYLGNENNKEMSYLGLHSLLSICRNVQVGLFTKFNCGNVSFQSSKTFSFFT